MAEQALYSRSDTAPGRVRRAPGRICRTPDDAFRAGQDQRRASGFQLTQRQAEQVAAILRPHRRAAQISEDAA